jgi:2-polyprenyl-3-methyl-5-hydroxy-6-metoxy-1,4-benzoquinol methylase
MNQDKVAEFIGQFAADLSATEAAGSIVVGYRLGLYRALAKGPATPEQFAERTGCSRRYLTEWLRGQAAGGYATYDTATGEFSLTEEQAFCLADPNGPNVAAAFLLALGMLRAEPQITEAFRTGAGFGWHEHHEDVFTGCDAFFRPGYVAALVPEWIPALDGVQEKLSAGGRIADLGCGFGASSVLMAQAFPRTTVAASDYHSASIDEARKRAAEAGVGERVSFEVESAQTFGGEGYDLVTMFDALHDMGDPLGAARRIKQALAPDGTWLLVEPNSSDRVEENFTTIGRAYYSGSTFLCLPNSLSQTGGYSLGAQAGESAIRRIAEEAGFTRFRKAAETPFNHVYEIRP